MTDKLNKINNILEDNFVIFGIKTSTNAKVFSDLRKQSNFKVVKKTLLKKALEKKNIEFDISSVTKNKQTLCILTKDLMLKTSLLLEKKEHRSVIELHLIHIDNNCFTNKESEIKNFYFSSIVYGKNLDKQSFILHNIMNIFSSSMKNFLFIIDKIIYLNKNN